MRFVGRLGQASQVVRVAPGLTPAPGAEDRASAGAGAAPVRGPAFMRHRRLDPDEKAGPGRICRCLMDAGRLGAAGFRPGPLSGSARRPGVVPDFRVKLRVRPLNRR